MNASWEDKVAGRACPFDHPREDNGELSLVRKLSVSSLYLQRNQTYRGHSVLIYDTAHVLRIDELSTDEWSKLAHDLRAAEAAVHAAVQPDHVNVASLGNIVPHLHWHIVPRYKTDPSWGGPIWTQHMPVTQLAESDFRALARKIDGLVRNDGL